MKAIRLRGRVDRGFPPEERVVMVETETETEWVTPLLPWLGETTRMTFSKSMWEEVT